MLGEGRFDLPFDGPVLHARLRPVAPEAINGQTLFAFAGIGRPEKFFRLLRDYGAKVTDAVGFGDHHRYTEPEIARLKAAAAQRGARLVTTEKDFVRLTPALRAGITPVPVRAEFADEAAMIQLLDRLWPARA